MITALPNTVNQSFRKKRFAVDKIKKIATTVPHKRDENNEEDNAIQELNGNVEVERQNRPEIEIHEASYR